MASANITQLRRAVIRKWDKATSKWVVNLTLEADDLGKDTIVKFNIAPKMASRSSSLGSTETPMTGTLEKFSASMTLLLDNWYSIGKLLNSWTPATYTGATNANGHIIGDDSALCHQDYVSIVFQGMCDDGSSADIEFTRCIPTVDDDIEVGTSETPQVTVNLHPIVYNAKTHAGDGYPAYSYRLGDFELTAKKRLNASTGAYA